MSDLSLALESGNLVVLLWTAGTLGFLHTILGPDHYIPFVMMSKAQNWSRRKTAFITFLCGLGHVGSSIIIGILLVWLGMAAAEWGDSRFAFWQDVRGSFTAWLLMGVGVAFTIWGIKKAYRGQTHSHSHIHENSTEHTHEHDHNDDHMHPHTNKVSLLTPWVLFTIFVFGPCESIIPLMLSAWSTSGIIGVTLVSSIFAITTIITIMGTVAILMAGIKSIPLGKLNRWSTALAGISLVACGAAIQFLGL